MCGTSVLTVLLLTCLPLRVSAANTSAERRKAETLVKADELFGERYSPAIGKSLRLYDERTETGPPDAVLYRHGTSYVTELIFASDGSIARVQLLPEALLYSDTWSDVADAVELSRAEMESFLQSVSTLQPLGKGEFRDAPNGCFQSGHNLYCTDHYAHAIVHHYHLERSNKPQVTNIVLRHVGVAYRQAVMGVVQDVKRRGGKTQINVDGQWYEGEKNGVSVFDDATTGSVVQLVSFGCTANKKACIAIPVIPPSVKEANH